MTDDEALLARILSSRRYRHVEPGIVRRLVGEERPRGGRDDEVARRVRRRLHQVVGAVAAGKRFHRAAAALRDAWQGDVDAPGFRAACRTAMAAHASTRERDPYLDTFYRDIWSVTGRPDGSILDLGCGLGPLAIPWMGISREVRYVAVDVDAGALAVVEQLFALIGQAGAVESRDLARADGEPTSGLQPCDVALLLKLVPTLDRQAAGTAERLLAGLRARHAVVSFPARSLGGRAKGMDRTYRARLEQLTVRTPRVRQVTEASVPNELVFVLELADG